MSYAAAIIWFLQLSLLLFFLFSPWLFTIDKSLVFGKTDL